jgi:hypothetical protein
VEWEREAPAGPRRRWVLAVVLGVAALGGAVALALARAAPPDAAPDPGFAVVTPAKNRG